MARRSGTCSTPCGSAFAGARRSSCSRSCTAPSARAPTSSTRCGPAFCAGSCATRTRTPRTIARAFDGRVSTRRDPHRRRSRAAPAARARRRAGDRRRAHRTVAAESRSARPRAARPASRSRSATRRSRGTGATPRAGAASAGAATTWATRRCTCGACPRSRRRACRRCKIDDRSQAPPRRLRQLHGPVAGQPARHGRHDPHASSPQVMLGYAQALADLARFVNREELRDWDTIPVIYGAERLWAHDRCGSRAGVWAGGVRDLRLPRVHADGQRVRDARRAPRVGREPRRRDRRPANRTVTPRLATPGETGRGRGHRPAQPEPARSSATSPAISRSRARRRRARAAGRCRGSGRSRAASPTRCATRPGTRSRASCSTSCSST